MTDGFDRCVCIHGHFYQPPRENPWIERIERQEDAAPYHDWNERIAAECYAPNARSRILDEKDRITAIVNNYSRISFNFGPTLLSWMERHAGAIYAAVLDADRRSRERFSGHGSAMAQAYGHAILPLASAADKELQVAWGLRDFAARFGRPAEGLWLPETAVDIPSLEVLARHGVRFTILAPHQARRIRGPEDADWRETPQGSVDPTRAYECRLPSGRSIALFFYDGPVSRAIAFERLLDSGEAFARRLSGIFSDRRTGPQIASVATDGESYGHHHRHGDMALAFAINRIETQGFARLTNFGEFLYRHPPRHLVEIHENTSWSCGHGVERWRADCGCSTGSNPKWRQAWRAPLREALDFAAAGIEALYAELAPSVLIDPAEALLEHVEVARDRKRERVDAFIARHARDPATSERRVLALRVLEMRRQAALMYTSCGFFFDDVAGIETVQVLRHAARALDLGRVVGGPDIETGFVERLAAAPGNRPEAPDGAAAYQRLARPATAQPARVAVHHAVVSAFDLENALADDAHEVVVLEKHDASHGQARLLVERVSVASKITEESEELRVAAVHLGGFSVSAGVDDKSSPLQVDSLWTSVAGPFERGEFADVLRLLDTLLGGTRYSLRSLFRDERRRVVEGLMSGSLDEARSECERVYEGVRPLLHHLAELRVPVPAGLKAAASLVLDARLFDLLRGKTPDAAALDALLEEARQAGVVLDAEAIRYHIGQHVERAAAVWTREPKSVDALRGVLDAVDLAERLPVGVDVSAAQNAVFDVAHLTAPSGATREWSDLLGLLADRVRVRVPRFAKP